MLFIAIAAIVLFVLFANLDSDESQPPQKGDNMNAPTGFYACEDKALLEAFIKHAKRMNEITRKALEIHRETESNNFIELCLEAALFDGQLSLMAAERLGLLSVVCEEVTLEHYSSAEETIEKVLSSHDCPLKAFHALHDPGYVEFTDERYEELIKDYDNVNMTVRNAIKKRHAAIKSVVENFDASFERAMNEMNSAFVS